MPRKNKQMPSHKQKQFQSILNTAISKKLEFTEEDLEPYWIEFRLMANSSDNLSREGLKNLLSSLNVGGRAAARESHCG